LLQQRVGTLENRLNDIEEAFGAHLERLDRRTMRNELAVDRILAHLGVAAPTDEEVDAALEDQDTKENAPL
jgi:hypothetical protein